MWNELQISNSCGFLKAVGFAKHFPSMSVVSPAAASLISFAIQGCIRENKIDDCIDSSEGFNPSPTLWCSSRWKHLKSSQPRILLGSIQNEIKPLASKWKTYPNFPFLFLQRTIEDITRNQGLGFWPRWVAIGGWKVNQGLCEQDSVFYLRHGFRILISQLLPNLFPRAFASLSISSSLWRTRGTI